MPVGAHPKLHWPGVKSFFGDKYNEHPKECEFLFDYMTSDKSREEFVELTNFGYASNKSKGGAVRFDDAAQGYTTTLYHTAYALGYELTREDLDDDQYGRFRQLTQALAFSMRSTWETVAANVYNRAETAGYTGGDGVVMLSTSHPTASGNQANKLTVDADLSEASLEDACILIGSMKNQRGLPISVMPKSLIIPHNNAFEATRILKSQLQSGTANNDTNALREMGMFPDGIKISHYITDTDSWFIRTNLPESMVGLTRVATEVSQDGDFTTDNARVKSYFRKSVGWTDFRGIVGSLGG